MNCPEYCSECDYKCCPIGCYEICNPSPVCQAFPIKYHIKGYFSPFGPISNGGWEVTTLCVGLGIKINERTLSDVLNELVNNINTNEVIELESNNVKIRMIEVNLSEVKKFSSIISELFVNSGLIN